MKEIIYTLFFLSTLMCQTYAKVVKPGYVSRDCPVGFGAAKESITITYTQPNTVRTATKHKTATGWFWYQKVDWAHVRRSYAGFAFSPKKYQDKVYGKNRGVNGFHQWEPNGIKNIKSITTQTRTDTVYDCNLDTWCINNWDSNKI